MYLIILFHKIKELLKTNTMKNILYYTLTISFLLFISCKNNTKTGPAGSTFTDAENVLDYDNPSIVVSIAKGPLKGTYNFKKSKSNSFNLNYFDNTTKNVNQRNSSQLILLGLIAKDSLFTLNSITKTFKGKISKGTHEARMAKNSSGDQFCSRLEIVDVANKHSWSRIYGKNISCNATIIHDLSEWKEGSIFNKRAVHGSFTDTFELEIKKDDNSPSETIITDITVTFNVRHQKSKY